MKNSRWTAKYIPSLKGKIALVTGANSGLGYHTSLELARRGACVIMACRSEARARSAWNQIQGEIAGADVIVMTLDLASLTSIRAFAETVQKKFTRLDILINNAGIMGIPHQITADGFEVQFGVNHLGHYALTGLLLRLLNATPESRVVTVSSMMHQFGVVDFDDLMGEKAYRPWRAYSQSKLANLLFSYELQRRLSAQHSATRSIGAHPGYAATHLQLVSAEMKGSNLERRFDQLLNTLLAQPAGQGALPELFAATAPQVPGGAYVGPGGLGGSRGYPKLVKSSARSYDLAAAHQLWQVSQELTGVVY